jgi:ubiquinone/menaquinone biosynthesis C-methylase UbiE
MTRIEPPYTSVWKMFSAVSGYDRFMGRFSVPLASELAAFANLKRGDRALDVGCGTGALLGELVKRLGADAVAGVDPSEAFVAAARSRYPGVQLSHGTAERLPFGDASFDAALAQLVVHFMDEPVEGLREMARVTRAGGVVAACVWDHAGGTGPLELFWSAARELDPNVDDESARAGTRRGELERMFRTAGLAEVEESALTVAVEYSGFEEWWEMFTLGVAPAGMHVAGLEAAEREALRARCGEQFAKLERPTISGSAWAVRGRVNERGTHA